MLTPEGKSPPGQCSNIQASDLRGIRKNRVRWLKIAIRAKTRAWSRVVIVPRARSQRIQGLPKRKYLEQLRRMGEMHSSARNSEPFGQWKDVIVDSPSGRSKSEGSEPTDPEEAARKNENEGNDDAKPPG